LSTACLRLFACFGWLLTSDSTGFIVCLFAFGAVGDHAQEVKEKSAIAKYRNKVKAARQGILRLLRTYILLCVPDARLGCSRFSSTRQRLLSGQRILVGLFSVFLQICSPCGHPAFILQQC
jgi:hypothetical protein